MVTTAGNTAAREPQRQNEPDHVARAARLATAFAERAPVHDRDGSFPFQNFDDLSKAGLLALTVPAALGGGGAGAAEVARILGIIGKADPSTALVLSMHYIQHLVMARSSRWPARLSRKLARETVEGVALINALRVEPELGIAGAGRAARDDRPAYRNRVAAERPQDLFDRRADPEMVCGVGPNR